MPKASRKSAMPGNVTKRQVAKVENRKSYNKAVESVKRTGSADVDFSVYGKYRKPKAVIQTDSGKSKVVKQSFKSEDLKNKKAVGKQNKKYSKTIYK
jgi:hypothetical protein